MSSSYLSGHNRRREGQHKGKWWSSWVLPRVTPGSSHVVSVFGGAPVLTASQCWQASWTEGFWTPDWNRAFSEMDCQFAKGGRALGISDIGCTQECKKLSLFLQLMVVNGGSAREFARWKVLYASGLISYVHPWEVRALRTHHMSALLWEGSFLCCQLICFWKGASRRGSLSPLPSVCLLHKGNQQTAEIIQAVQCHHQICHKLENRCFIYIIFDLLTTSITSVFSFLSWSKKLSSQIEKLTHQQPVSGRVGIQTHVCLTTLVLSDIPTHTSTRGWARKAEDDCT